MRLSARTRANRLNAKLSTGPRTPHGKSTASANARTHGLTAVRIAADKRPLVDALAEALRAGGVQGDTNSLANAMVDIARIHQLRSLIFKDSSDPSHFIKVLDRLERYERKTRACISRLVEAHDLGLIPQPQRRYQEKL